VAGLGGVLLGRRLRNWGSRPGERALFFAEQGLVPGPDAALTQAISIQAPPEAVWPWLVQLGQDKGGFYSYAKLENLLGAKLTNAERIVPAWQGTREGDRLMLHPSFALEVQSVRPPSTAINGRFVAGRQVSKGVGFQWIFAITPEGDNARLVVRERYVVPSRWLRAVAQVATLGSAAMSQLSRQHILKKSVTKPTMGRSAWENTSVAEMGGWPRTGGSGVHSSSPHPMFVASMGRFGIV
jgi:hypothetical protein